MTMPLCFFRTFALTIKGLSMKQTKIVCTISDQHCEQDFLRHLFFAGMNVVRMNTAHATPDGIRQIIRNTRAVSPHLALLIDTKGPEVRTTDTKEPILFRTGEQVTIIGNPEVTTTHEQICVSYTKFADDVKVGDDVLFDDGALAMRVTANDGHTLTVQVLNNGTLGAHKSVNVPGAHIALPSLTDRDKRMIRLAIDQDIDFIAHSFVRSADDVHDIQHILDDYHSDIKIISKIENQEGVDNIDEIIDASYGIMVARGDLGIEVPIEQIPGIQRRIIQKCIQKHKPVIVATQMLHTMINNPRPTRAEVTDIANAVFSHTDALMLSGETANGKYPLEAVKTMARVAEQAELDAHREGYLKIPIRNINQREFISKSAIEATEYLGVKGIITDSGTGETARTLASFRGPNPVLAICYREKLQRWLNLSYGIIAIHQQQHVTAQYMFTAALRMLRQKGFIGNEDKIAYLSGSLGKGNGTTFLEINQVKEVFSKRYRFHLPEPEA